MGQWVGYMFVLWLIKQAKEAYYGQQGGSSGEIVLGHDEPPPENPGETVVEPPTKPGLPRLGLRLSTQ